MYSLFFAAALAILTYFIVSLSFFCSQKKEEEQVHPAMRNSAQSKKWLFHLVLSSVLLGIVVLVVVSIVSLFSNSIRFM